MLRISARLLLAIALSLPAWMSAGAQDAPDSAAALPLARVRLTLPSETVVGTVLSVSRDSALLQTAGPRDGDVALAQRWVPLGCVSRAALSMGQGPRWRSTVMYAVLVGIGGAVLGATSGKFIKGTGNSSEDDQDSAALGPEHARRVRTVQFGIGGTVLGAIIGLRNPRERWQTLPESQIGSVRPRTNCEGY